MGDLNQLDFVRDNIHKVKGPVLEIGSRNFGNTCDFRSLVKAEPYVGIDQSSGDRVDIECDFTKDYQSLKSILGISEFGTIFCFSVLEHCRDPFKMADNIVRFLKKDGVLFLGVPFVWNIHGFPDDYWRFTPSSIKVLFPGLSFNEDSSFYSTKKRGERIPLNSSLARLESFKVRPLFFGKWLRKLKIIEPTYSYVLFPVMINAMLQKGPK